MEETWDGKREYRRKEGKVGGGKERRVGGRREGKKGRLRGGKKRREGRRREGKKRRWEEGRK